MFKRVGALALILSAAAILQPTAAFAQDRYDGRHGDRGYYHERDHDRREWRDNERREWREHEWREHHRDYDRNWRYRDGRAFYFGAGPNYGSYEAPAPYYPVDPYWTR